MGRVVVGYKLDAMGICYAHIHGKGKITKNDLVDFWSHAVHGREMPDATNPAYRALLGVGPEVDDSPKYWQSAGAYACLLYTSPSPRDKRQSRMPSSA